MAFHAQPLQITNHMHRLDIFLHSFLIQMYAAYGSMGDALGVFSTIFQPNQVFWTALVLGRVDARLRAQSWLKLGSLEAWPDTSRRDHELGVPVPGSRDLFIGRFLQQLWEHGRSGAGF
ncbi:uncharacterized protein LOC112341866 [Selaginella moellendorffii]|uniref:uncharacterized protein LOC112341866 n=1 Tax=Selaginella moellendorffii TaxID=88036 RepID=UPI000D1CAD43|nr:uncharacterized protein LOC112341866 [Selaginella moellendorffii]|eukprot:XP_024518511.1 uncharacterized protein LOC112341866 [Selaginella moellendorffii]